MVRVLCILTTILGAGSIAAAFAIKSPPWSIIGAIAFIVLWISGYLRNWQWLQNAGLLFIFGLACLGFLLGLSATLLFCGSFFALAGWDLVDFSRRLRNASPEDDLRALEHQHFLRLGSGITLGVILVMLAVNIRLQIPFGWMIILALLAALGLGKMVSSLLKID
jgi:hypothetical protein